MFEMYMAWWKGWFGYTDEEEKPATVTELPVKRPRRTRAKSTATAIKKKRPSKKNETK